MRDILMLGILIAGATVDVPSTLSSESNVQTHSPTVSEGTYAVADVTLDAAGVIVDVADAVPVKERIASLENKPL